MTEAGEDAVCLADKKVISSRLKTGLTKTFFGRRLVRNWRIKFYSRKDG